ncbi:hypothetical protein ACFPER_14205 [Agromyces aurantiacus]|uniref:Uncharacterized protein n=1 Tax=Agromyces aurantiacus TaxID=165814 RepID=A0ABV9R9G4_9MICO|nr:hypothetical protein [Agromyces aurantiacus]MBM7505153.1 hypothetical protein [Agromyces aurantiacus]
MVDQPELGPDDDPYAAYLVWRAEREAAAAAAADLDGTDAAAAVDATAAAPARGSWVRRLAVWHRNAG